MGVSKTIYHIKIKIRMPNPSQESPASSMAPNHDLNNMYILCTFIIQIESKNSDHGYIKDQRPYPNKFKMPNPTQETPASSKAPNDDLKYMDVLFTFKIKIKS